MRVLIHNTVKTDYADYTFNTREEAEAFYMSLRVERGAEREPRRPPPGPKARRTPQRHGPAATS
ncbi:MAG TPA: hypothetical protein VFA75_05960 [Nevskia sp.]|nr:hypothetical protein [Nevskia sp.]